MDSALSQVFHANALHQSYLNLGYSVNLQSKLNDITSAMLQCGKTKTEATTEKVLCPKSIRIVKKDLLNISAYYKSFAISTDTCNQGNKNFPVIVVYFYSSERGKQRVLDVFESSNKTATAFFEYRG